MPERFLPIARTEDLIVQEMGPETLVFDRRTDVAHNLSPIASVVWALCDGKHDLEALVAAVTEIETADAQVATEAALAELGELGLLIDGVSRRETMKKMAKFGAGAFAVPLVVSVMAPAAAMAGSGQIAANQTCTTSPYDQCQPGLNCVQGQDSSGANSGGLVCYGGAATKCYVSNVKPGPGANDNCSSSTRSLCCSGQCNGSKCL